MSHLYDKPQRKERQLHQPRQQVYLFFISFTLVLDRLSCVEHN